MSHWYRTCYAGTLVKWCIDDEFSFNKIKLILANVADLFHVTHISVFVRLM